jgi:hypothetical protein
MSIATPAGAASSLTGNSDALMGSWNNYMFPKLQGQLDTTGQAANNFTSRMNTMADTATGWANDYRNKQTNLYDPLERNIIGQANDYNTPGNIERQSALAEGDVNTEFDNNRQAQQRQMQSYGINPNSGRYEGTQQAAGVQQSAAAAAAGTRARDAAVQLGWQKQLDAASMGKNNVANATALNSAAQGESAAGLTAQNTQLGNTANVSAAQNSVYAGANSGYSAAGGIGAQIHGIDTNATTAANANATNRYGIDTSAATTRYGIDTNKQIADQQGTGRLIGTGLSGIMGGGAGSLGGAIGNGAAGLVKKGWDSWNSSGTSGGATTPDWSNAATATPDYSNTYSDWTVG